MNLLDRSLDWLKKYDQILLFGMLLLAALFLIQDAYSYRHSARLLPLLALVVLCGLVILRLSILVIEMRGRGDILQRVTDQIAVGSKSTEEMDSFASVGQPSNEDQQDSVDIHRAIYSVGWVLIFTLAFYVFGIIYPIPVLLFVFLYLNYDAPLIHSLLITIITFGLLYIMFVVLLNIRVYEGIVF